MAIKKLTISVEDRLIEKVKKLAIAQETSVSAIVSRFLETVTHENADMPLKLGPITRRASGLISSFQAADSKQILGEVLTGKYRLSK